MNKNIKNIFNSFWFDFFYEYIIFFFVSSSKIKSTSSTKPKSEFGIIELSAEEYSKSSEFIFSFP